MQNNNPGHRSLRKGRFSGTNQIFLITTVTNKRQRFFEPHSAARTVSYGLHQTDIFESALCLCWVVMPDHLHLLVQLDNEPLSTLMNRLKSKLAIAVNASLQRTGALWAKSYHDHGLRQEESIRSVARYIVYNPVRAGLVNKPGDYPYWNAVWL